MSWYDTKDEIPAAGFPLSHFAGPLRRPRPGESRARPPIRDFEARVRANVHFRAWAGVDAGARTYDVAQGWHHLPFRCFSDFTTDELCRLLQSTSVMSGVYHTFEETTRHWLIRKLDSSLYKWGVAGARHREDYSRFVELYDALRRFDFGLPGFSTTLDMTRGEIPYGYSRCAQIYLDGPLAYLIHRDGRHVLTVGVAATAAGILVTQVQMARARGNRWLYRLPGGQHYLNYVLDRLRLACGRRVSLWLADGCDVAAAEASRYENPAKWPPAAADHIIRVYNRPLAHFRRARAAAFRVQPEPGHHCRFRAWRLVRAAPAPARDRAAQRPAPIRAADSGRRRASGIARDV